MPLNQTYSLDTTGVIHIDVLTDLFYFSSAFSATVSIPPLSGSIMTDFMVCYLTLISWLILLLLCFSSVSMPLNKTYSLNTTGVIRIDVLTDLLLLCFSCAFSAMVSMPPNKTYSPHPTAITLVDFPTDFVVTLFQFCVCRHGLNAPLVRPLNDDRFHGVL